MTERFEVQRTIEAEPAAVFAVLRDPQGHVAIDSSGMLQSADGEPAAAVGDTFVVHMDRESLNDYPLGRYDVTVEIVTYEQDREIAWTIHGQLKPDIGHVYGYRLEPTDGGTLVTRTTTGRTSTRTGRRPTSSRSSRRVRCGPRSASSTARSLGATRSLPADGADRVEQPGASAQRPDVAATSPSAIAARRSAWSRSVRSA